MGVVPVFRRLLLIVFLTVGGCAQLPIAGSADGFGLPAVRNMPACGVSVRFSGHPVELSEGEAKVVARDFGEYAKWEITGWKFHTHRLLELAVCACRDYPLTAAEFEDNPPADVTRNYVIEGIGEALEMEKVQSSQEKTRLKIVRLKSASSCMLVQQVVSPTPNNAAAAFFPSLALTPNVAPRLSAQPPAGSVAERLRQLDQLLKDRLISPDEYNTRRRVVLDSL